MNWKRLSTLFTGLLCVIFLCSCIPTDPSDNRLDSRRFYTNIKPDSNANYGKKAAFYNSRIYYLSAESGTQGIYSMNAEGSDVRFEQAAEDIRALAVNSEGLYYSGFSGIRENRNGPFRCFRLYRRDSAQSKPVDLLEQTKRAGELTDENVWDFYIASNGYIYIRLVGVDWPESGNYISMISYVNGEILPALNYQSVVTDYYGFRETSAKRSFRLLKYAKQYATADSGSVYSQDSLEIYAEYYITLYDASINRTVLPIDGIFLADAERTDYAWHRWILRINANRMLLAAESALLTYDLNTHKANDLLTFPSTESIYASYDEGNDILLLTRTLRKSGLINDGLRALFNIPVVKGSCLYRANPDTGAITKLLSLKRDEAFLYVDSQTAATASGQTISLYDITGESPALIRTVKLQHPIVDAANKVDTAGGWLFLYGFNEQTQRDELLDKVFIG
jgi:hypothetical protein